MITNRHIGKIQKTTFRPLLGILPLKPLQPKNYPKYCNSVTLLKNSVLARIYWLQFLLQFLIRDQKNCNQLRPSSGYSFKNYSYTFIKKSFVTVTILINNTLNQINRWLQNYNFLERISGNHFTSSLYKKSEINLLLK